MIGTIETPPTWRTVGAGKRVTDLLWDKEKQLVTRQALDPDSSGRRNDCW